MFANMQYDNFSLIFFYTVSLSTLQTQRGQYRRGVKKSHNEKNNNTDLSPYSPDPYINNDKRKLNQSLIRILKVRGRFLMSLAVFRDA